jgi:HPt (histidine-containing phosphotransfer) domain-containing protein
MDDAIDAQIFRALQDSAGAEFVADLVDAFLDDAPRMLGTMRASLASGDADAFRRAAHSLKSNGLTFGAGALAAMARELELTARDVVESGDDSALARLAAEQARAASALGKLRDA